MLRVFLVSISLSIVFWFTACSDQAQIACTGALGKDCTATSSILPVGDLPPPGPPGPPGPIPPSPPGAYKLTMKSSINVIRATDTNNDSGCNGGGLVPGKNGNDIWGWTSPSGNKIAIMGKSSGTAFVDVTDPNNPVHLADLRSYQGKSCLWGDMKVYQNYVYIVSESPGHGMLVLDLNNLPDKNEPGLPKIINQADYHYQGFGSAHNIIINEESGYAYAAGATSFNSSQVAECDKGLHIISLQNPINPVKVGCLDGSAYSGIGGLPFMSQIDMASYMQTLASKPVVMHPENGEKYTHDAQCVMYNGPDTEHVGKEICVVSNGPLPSNPEQINLNSFNIVDVSNKGNPKALSLLTYEIYQAGYAHQGWLTEDHRFFIANDELDEYNSFNLPTRTFIIDITDLDDPFVTEVYSHTGYRCIDHNLYVKGNKVYEANYTCGVVVLDIQGLLDGVQTNGSYVQEVARYDTYAPNNSNQFEGGSWSVYPYFEDGIIVSSNMDGNLYIYQEEN